LVGALDEEEVGRRLQALQAHRRFELAGAHLKAGEEAGVDVGVLEDGRAAAEVRHQPEVEDFKNRPFEDGTGAADDEGVDRPLQVVVVVEAAVELDVAAEPELKGVVRRADREAVAAGGDRGR